MLQYICDIEKLLRSRYLYKYSNNSVKFHLIVYPLDGKSSYICESTVISVQYISLCPTSAIILLNTARNLLRLQYLPQLPLQYWWSHFRCFCQAPPLFRSRNKIRQDNTEIQGTHQYQSQLSNIRRVMEDKITKSSFEVNISLESFLYVFVREI